MSKRKEWNSSSRKTMLQVKGWMMIQEVASVALCDSVFLATNVERERRNRFVTVKARRRGRNNDNREWKKADYIHSVDAFKDERDDKQVESTDAVDLCSMERGGKNWDRCTNRGSSEAVKKKKRYKKHRKKKDASSKEEEKEEENLMVFAGLATVLSGY